MKPPLFFKKYLFFIFISLYASAQAQIQLGLRVAPALSFTQAKDLGYYYRYTSGGEAGFGGSIGPTADFFLTHSLSISTGLWYTVKAANINFNTGMGVYYYDENGRIYQRIFEDASSQYILSYLQLPLTLKGYTKESSSGIRFYVQMGGSFDLRVGEKALNADENLLFQVSYLQNRDESLFKAHGWSLYAGLGLEKKVGDRTLFFAGLAYQRTIGNQINSEQVQSALFSLNPISVRYQLPALEMGVKF